MFIGGLFLLVMLLTERSWSFGSILSRADAIFLLMDSLVTHATDSIYSTHRLGCTRTKKHNVPSKGGGVCSKSKQNCNPIFLVCFVLSAKFQFATILIHIFIVLYYCVCWKQAIKLSIYGIYNRDS